MSNEKNRKAAAEAMLFASGDSVELRRIADSLGMDGGEADRMLREMQAEYEASDERGIRLIELDGSWQLITKNEYYDELIKLEINAKKPVLTDVLMETLSIIAYRQPVTRMEIEKIRGVNSDHAISRLIDFDLVKEVGRVDAPGRPMLFGTTESFLRCFGLSRASDLPEINPVRKEDFREEAEEEVRKMEGAPEEGQAGNKAGEDGKSSDSD